MQKSKAAIEVLIRHVTFLENFNLKVDKVTLSVYNSSGKGGNPLCHSFKEGVLMLTSLGRFLRKLRIDNGEILKNMADRLNVTVSFLSAVENGKKHMPPSWNTRICSLYKLNNQQQSEFSAAVAETEDTLAMDFNGVSLGNRELAVSFARKFAEFDEEQLANIKKILEEDRK